MAATSSSNQKLSSLPSLNPQRIQSLKTFLASDEQITIVPSFSYKAPLNFLLTHDSIGPFQAGLETTVPLWLAIYLRKRNFCKLRCPEWMQVDHLKRVLAHERDPNEDSFSKDLPFRYAEISRAVLQACGAGRSAVHAAGGMGGNEEVVQAEVVRVLLEDISMVRMDKIRRNLHTLSAKSMGESLERPMPVLDVTGIGAVEMAAIKPFLEGVFEDHLRLVRSGTKDGDDADGEGARNRRGRNVARSNRARRRNTDDDDVDNNNDDDEEGMDGGNELDSAAEDSNAPAVSKSRIRRYRS